MFRALLANLKKHPKNDEIITQRRAVRRERDACIILINRQAYPVENWSMGGALVQADSKSFGIGNEVDITLKFRLSEGIMDIAHRAHIVRKSKNKIALQFLPLTKTVKSDLQNVLNHYAKNHFILPPLNK